MFCKYYLASKSNICKILKYQLQTKKFLLFTFTFLGILQKYFFIAPKPSSYWQSPYLSQP